MFRQADYSESVPENHFKKTTIGPTEEELVVKGCCSGVRRGPVTSTGSLASQRHPGRFPKVPGP